MALKINKDVSAKLGGQIEALFTPELKKVAEEDHRLHIETLNKHLSRKYEVQPFSIDFDFSEDEERGTYKVTASLYGNILFAFYLTPFPACCGISILHHFTAISPPYFPEEVLHKSLDLVIREVAPYVSWQSRRLIVVMVERRAGLQHTTANHQFEDIPSVENPSMVYPELFRYFHKQKKVNTQLMWNKNTGNVLHHMEVLFDTEKFPNSYL